MMADSLAYGLEVADSCSSTAKSGCSAWNAFRGCRFRLTLRDLLESGLGGGPRLFSLLIIVILDPCKRKSNHIIHGKRIHCQRVAAPQINAKYFPSRY